VLRRDKRERSHVCQFLGGPRIKPKFASGVKKAVIAKAQEVLAQKTAAQSIPAQNIAPVSMTESSPMPSMTYSQSAPPIDMTPTGGPAVKPSIPWLYIGIGAAALFMFMKKKSTPAPEIKV
jgi:hypothetical protein